MSEKVKVINNWYVDHVKRNSTDPGINPCLINDELALESKIPIDYLYTFGYVSNGPCLGITGIYRTDNMNEQICAVVDILSKELSYQQSEPKWYHIRNYLRNYKGKMRLSKIIPMSKIETESIKRTIDIVDNEYQSICSKV